MHPLCGGAALAAVSDQPPRAAACRRPAAAALGARCPGDAGRSSGPVRPTTATAVVASVYEGAKDRLSGPSAVAATGSRVWVTSVLGNSVTALNARTGASAAVLPVGTDGFHGPDAIAIGGSHIWIANVPGNSFTELNSAAGALERTLYNGLGLRTANRMRLAVGNDGSWRYWCLGWGCGTANKTVGRKPWEVDDGLWERIAQLLPVVKRNYGHPGRKRLDDRKVLCGILFVLCAGIR